MDTMAWYIKGYSLFSFLLHYYRVVHIVTNHTCCRQFQQLLVCILTVLQLLQCPIRCPHLFIVIAKDSSLVASISKMMMHSFLSDQHFTASWKTGSSLTGLGNLASSLQMFLVLFFYTWILSCQCIVRLFLGILVCGIYVLYMFRSEKFQESSHLFCSKCISLRAQFKDLLLYYTAEPSSEGRWEKILFSGCVVFCLFEWNIQPDCISDRSACSLTGALTSCM